MSLSLCSTGKYCSPDTSTTWALNSQNFIIWNRYYAPFAVQQRVDVYIYDTYNTRDPIAKFIGIENGTGTLGVTPNPSWFKYALSSFAQKRAFVFTVTPNGTPPDIPDSQPFYIIGSSNPNAPTPFPTGFSSPTSSSALLSTSTVSSTMDSSTIDSSTTDSSTTDSSTITTSFSATSTSSNVTTATTILTKTENDFLNQSLPTKSKVLIAVFSTLFLLLLILLMMIIILRKKRTNKEKYQRELYNTESAHKEDSLSSRASGVPLMPAVVNYNGSTSYSEIDQKAFNNIKNGDSSVRNSYAHSREPAIMDSPRAVVPGVGFSTRTGSSSSISKFSYVPNSHNINSSKNSINIRNHKSTPVNHLQDINVTVINQGLRDVFSRAPRDTTLESDDMDDLDDQIINDNSPDNIEETETWREDIALDRLNKALFEDRSIIHNAQKKTVGKFSNLNAGSSNSVNQGNNTDNN
ncbi:hypothetical protein BB561_000812 [Smittium simulii]|uniref:Uncharacterized protein n=1 Tax=Smittium simulii TaxID=133385 RepID=A0A2T9YXG0_9FUNG|nr:hypothetical protein BB561_000812 [Smittium simulii]